MNEYIENVIKTVERRDNAKPEYIQCVKEVFRSLEKVIEQHPEYVEDDLLTRMAEPDRLITFRIAWVDDAGKTQINRGYRVQFNSSIGPYKGGLRFHPSVNSSIMYFLGFEQTFKNSLTGLPMGGAKEVHIRPACPPLFYGCKYLNFSRSSSEMELITRRVISELEGDNVSDEVLKEYTDPDSEKYHNMVDEICKKLHFTSLKFHRLDDMIDAVGIGADKLCTYCWNGEE